MAAPGYIPPLLPTLVDTPPDGPAWEHEIKFDGYRTMLQLGDGARAYTRRGFDWSERYAPVLQESKRLKCMSAYLDGEMVVQDEQGRSDFVAFQADLQAGKPDRFVFYAFDLLSLDGKDLRSDPLQERRQRLQELVGPHSPDRRIQFSESLAMDGAALLQECCTRGLEGIVSKRLSSRYRSGRQTAWLKAKCFEEEAFAIVGVVRETGKPAHALLARATGNGLVYSGSAFVTLADRDREQFWNYVETHRRMKPAVKMPARTKAIWIEPGLLGHVQFLRSGDKLRHSSLRALHTSLHQLAAQ